MKRTRILFFRRLLCFLLLSLLLLSLFACSEAEQAVYSQAVSSKATPLYLIPDGYSYPDGTAQHYIDIGVNLPADFVRPDLIWEISAVYDIGSVYKSGEVIIEVRFTDDPDAEYAVQFCFTPNFDKATALYAYLAEQGWEDTKLGSEEEPIFAATKAQIEAIDLDALQAAIGITEEAGITISHARHEMAGTIEHFPIE
ncbi:MAG: hypothetical protein IJW62_08100 [Clostridia bacterium]|nr:hypothetical protein [Clostridia bacterium]